MKRIVSIFLIGILTTALFVSCGSSGGQTLEERENQIVDKLQGKDHEKKELTEGTLYNTLAGVAPGSKAYSILNNDKKEKSILIKLNIKKSNKKDELKEFIDKTAKISTDIGQDLADTSTKNLVFLMEVDNKFVGNNIDYQLVNDKMEHENTFIESDYQAAFEESKKENEANK